MNEGRPAGAALRRVVPPVGFPHVPPHRVVPWNDDATPDAIAAIAAALRACVAELPGVRQYACGPDVASARGLAPTEDRYDFALVGDFDDERAWRVYDDDPEHNRVHAELIRPFIAGRVVVQLEL